MFQKKKQQLKIIIAPHEVSKKSIKNLEKIIQLDFAKWTTYEATKDRDKPILIIDTIGKLAEIYSYAEFAYVGGGMKKNRLHNTLEPAAYGIPVIIGKYFDRFREANYLVKKGGFTSIKSSFEFITVFDQFIYDKDLVEKVGKINSEYILKSLGASKIIIGEIENDLKIQLSN